MLVFALTAHEYAHAATALRQGDDTAYLLGRVTLNPVPHIDPRMSLLLPTLLYFGTQGAFTFGGAKPVPVNPRKYRKFVRGDLLVSAAGVATNFVLAFVFAFLYVLLGLLSNAAPAAAAVLETAQRMMVHGIWINLILCFFNLIPIPPLDGSHLLYHALPDLNWAGFYFREGTQLVLGPFQGKPACVRIEIGRGVCGTAAQRRETVVVPDVHEFPGHIACDSASNAEIVVPLLRGGDVLGVLDLDSPVRGRFDEADRAGLERLAAIWLAASP